MEINFNVDPSIKPQKLLRNVPFTTRHNRAVFKIMMIASSAFLIEAKQVSIVASLAEPFLITLVAASFYFPFFIIQANGDSKKQLNDELVNAVNLTSVSSLFCILGLSFASNKNWSLDFFGDLTCIGIIASLVISVSMALFLKGYVRVCTFSQDGAIYLLSALKGVIKKNKF